MIRIRKADQRGHFNHGWLDTYHTFSFGEYFDSEYKRFRTLRVMNEDRVEPAQGFGMHGHRDMEIITYVLEGELAHKDSLGNGSVLRPGMFQRMTAGSGIQHSEFNASETDPVHLYQIWLLPDAKGLQPGYEEATFADGELSGQLRIVASREGRDGSLTINQDADVFLSRLSAGQTVRHELGPQRHAWLQVLRGEVRLNSHILVAGDGAAVSGEEQLQIESTGQDAETMLFDLN